MAKFDFQLESVLRHRMSVEQQKQRALAEVRAVMAQWESRLREFDETVKAATEELRAHRLTGVLDMRFLAAHRRFVLSTERRAMDVVQQMARVQTQVEAAQRELAEAAKQRKIMEKLKERQFERWKAELGKKEAELMDEVGMQIAFGNVSRDADERAAAAGAEAAQ
jgi:flagellar FliJ protein